MTHYQGLIKQYQEFLPIDDSSCIVTLNEGRTPLVRLLALEREFNQEFTLYAKVEGANPTGSFKDRGMTLAISNAKQKGMRAVMCASTGNTSAAAAAYAARAGMQAFVIIPKGKIAQGKLVQAIAHGAKILQIDGNFDDAMRIVKKATQQLPIELVNSVNPVRLEGQKTAAFEIVDALGKAPDYHALPVGNAGNICAYWMGYCEYFTKNIAGSRPKMLGFQAQGAAPFVHGAPVSHPETLATAIRIGAPQSWDKAKAAASDSGGAFGSVTDEEIVNAQRFLAQKEGIFCEPASAASVAGLLQIIPEGNLPAKSTIVCTLTGNGLKDPDVVFEHYQNECVSLPVDEGAILGTLSDLIAAK